MAEANQIEAVNKDLKMAHFRAFLDALLANGAEVDIWDGLFGIELIVQHNGNSIKFDWLPANDVSDGVFISGQLAGSYIKILYGEHPVHTKDDDNAYSLPHFPIPLCRPVENCEYCNRYPSLNKE